MSRPPFDRTILIKGSPCTIYASDGTTVLAQNARVLISNAVQVKLIGTTRGDAIGGLFASTQSVTPGQVVNIPSVGVGWFLLAKVLNLSPSWRVQPGTSCTFLGLSFLLKGQRESTPQPTELNVYDEPLAVDSQGRPTVTSLQNYTVRAGFSNGNDPLSSGIEGPLPSIGSFTAYVGLTSPVQQADQLLLPDGRWASVQNTNVLYADGSPFAHQLILDLAAGMGYPPPSP